MTKTNIIRNRIRYWIKTLKINKKIVIKDATKEKDSVDFSAYTENKKNCIVIGFNSKIITLKHLSNHIDRVVLHELGHIMTSQKNSKGIGILNEYKAEKYMLSTLYKYNIELYKKLVNYMQEFLSDEYSFYCCQYPEHYKAFCKVYNIERIDI